MKFLDPGAEARNTGSAPTRGPWIEISCTTLDALKHEVGPHTGAVD